MKFMMIVLTIRFIAEVISNKRNKISHKGRDEMTESVRHPAEYGMR